MLNSVTWGTWDQIMQTTSNGCHRLGQSSAANSSEWRRRSTSAKGSELPLFERLLDRLIAAAPAAIPHYSYAPSGPILQMDWAALGRACHPRAGGLDDERAERKAQQVSPRSLPPALSLKVIWTLSVIPMQVENLLTAVCALVERRLRHSKAVHVVEFCGGAGYVAIPLAQVPFACCDHQAF